MCEFISWIEYKGEVLFLTKNELNTNHGQALRRHLGTQYENDVKGHGAIEWYYNLKPNSGTHKECTDFSSPDNFPRPIVSALKKGVFCGIGISEQLLTKPAWAEYEKIEQPALAEYGKIKQPAWAEYEKIEQPAWAEYGKIKQTAWAEYEKIEQPALAEYGKIKQTAFWKLFRSTKNRVTAWR